jgi:trk system potassium uptake protein
MFLTTAGVWVALSLLGSIPLHFASVHLSAIDALFETVSGVTTTGSTVITGLDTLAPDILVWRSVLQWIGGIGIVCMAVTLLPFLRVGGMRLFQSESSHWENADNIPRTKHLVISILQTYVLLTIICILAYIASGMSVFDAINNAFTTISTGGFSTSDRSFADTSSLVQWVAIVFMLAGSIPFTLYPELFHKHAMRLLKDPQVTALLLVVLAFTVAVFLNQCLSGRDGVFHAFSKSAFNLTSIITTTGFASDDYTKWGSFTIAAIFFATFIGGCSGSTSGGTKIFRLQLFVALIKEQLARTVHPKIAVTTLYAGRQIKTEIITALVAYFFLMLLSLVILTLGLSATELDFFTSLTGAATALMNVGPGLGDIIGPAGNFSSLSDIAKLLLCIGMLLGRLEFLTIIVLFTSSYWRG